LHDGTVGWWLGPAEPNPGLNEQIGLLIVDRGGFDIETIGLLPSPVTPEINGQILIGDDVDIDE